MYTPENIPQSPLRSPQGKHFKRVIKPVIILSMVIVNLVSCKESDKEAVNYSDKDTYYDVPFVQEYHEAYFVSNNPDDNEIRSIAVDHDSNVWIATGSGVFKKEAGKGKFTPVFSDVDRGPA
jgi:hypothetical protein